MARALKGYQAQEAQASLDALTKSLGMAQTRLRYYLNLLSSLETVTIAQPSSQSQLDRLFTASVELVNSLSPLDPPAKALTQLSLTVLQETRNALSEFDKVISGAAEPVAQQDEKVTLPMNRFEKRQIDELKSSNEKQLKAMDYEALAQILALIPDVKLGAPPTMGATFGGTQLSTVARVSASQLNYQANEHSYRANLHSILGGYQRRYDEWRHQCDLILGEMEQIGKQMLAACMRLAVATQELKNHEKQIQNAREVDEFMREKYTNKELYDWMAGQISVSYFQAYQLAYDLAKRAERAYRFELGVEDSNFIQFGYWDSLKKGLLAGEKLSHDLKRMETAYLDQNRREYEVTKHISLLSLDPIALIKLRQTGQCEVAIPEVVFDLDYPGHYLRRIKSASLTIPCVTGPYTGVNCTLTLLNSSVRHRTGVAGGYARNGESGGDPRFRDSFGAIQSVVTSSGQNDSGLFETSLRDERYLPFEGSGAISSWRLEMPSEIRQFDYNTISDVILHIRYTAREGGQALKDKAVANLMAQIAGATAAGMVRLFSVRHEFPSEWAKFKNAKFTEDVHTAELSLPLREEHYPYWSKGRAQRVIGVKALARVNDDTPEITITSAADGTDAGDPNGDSEVDRLTASPIRGLLQGTLSQSMPAVPFSASDPPDPIRLYFDNCGSIEDLWLAVIWGE
jgi:Tc toxin complex TcA C-terminal TcB-binding domain